MNLDKRGLFYGTTACIIWGFFPLYWPLLRPAIPLEILAHRVVWSLIVCLILIVSRKEFRKTFENIATINAFLWQVAAAITLSLNWLIFIWAINNNHFTETALGYYINPLITVVFALFFYQERLTIARWLAVCSGLIAAILLSFAYGRPPWIAFGIALTWSTYGTIKKKINTVALQTLAAETFVLFLPAVLYLGYLQGQGSAIFGHRSSTSILLAGAGLITTIPLLMFNAGTTRLPLSITGLLQYIQPSIQFLIAVFFLQEKMTYLRWIGFSFIWIALIILALDLTRDGFKEKNSR